MDESVGVVGGSSPGSSRRARQPTSAIELKRGADEDGVRLPGQPAGPCLPPRPPDQGDARQLRPLLRRDLQRQGDHGLERQLHGTKEPQNHAGQVGGRLFGIITHENTAFQSSTRIAIIFIPIFLFRCNSEHECSILADSDNFGGDPCPGVPKYLEVYFGCFPESTTMTSSTGPPLPPWLTTRPPVSFFPGLRDLDIRPRVPFTVSQDTTELSSAVVEEATSLPNNISTEEKKIVTVTEVVIEEEESDVTTTEKSLVVEMMEEDKKEEEAKEQLRMTKAKGEMERRRKEEEQRREEQEREEERRRLAYSSFSSQEEEVRVHISTLAPAPSVAPHMDTISPLSMCPPRNIRALSWSWSRPGSTASLACPPGTTGSATWTCSSSSSSGSGTPQWATPSPDLSDCQSLWMAKIIRELRKSELILGLASELMQYVSANPLYGGDVKSAVNAMTIITEKMQYQLEKVPTVEQREAMVMELAQATVKTASSL